MRLMPNLSLVKHNVHGRECYLFQRGSNPRSAGGPPNRTRKWLCGMTEAEAVAYRNAAMGEAAPMLDPFLAYARRSRGDGRDRGPREHDRSASHVAGRHRAESEGLDLGVDDEFSTTADRYGKVLGDFAKALMRRDLGGSDARVVTSHATPALVEWAARYGVEVVTP